MSEVDTIHRDTFKAGSKTYYNSSIFFPEDVRRDVYVLYGFVRVADNFVDAIPQDTEGFYRFRKRYERAMSGYTTNDTIIDSFVELATRKQFDPEWTDAFLCSMELDINKGVYETIDETLEYIYGSAEVIGLFMATIFGLPEKSYRYAQYLGRAMQYINFIRDIDEDRRLGRIYLPTEELDLPALDEDSARSFPEKFERFIEKQIDRYRQWQDVAESGYAYLPKRYRIAVKSASDMYNWTARKIAADPFVVFRRKVKPSKSRIILQGIANSVFAR